MTNILRKMHSPRNYPAPPQYITGMKEDLYTMCGGIDRISFGSSLIDENLIKSFKNEKNGSLINASIE